MIIVDPEFKALISPLSQEEREGLEKSLFSEGCRDNLIVWEEENILLDGHNRYEICKEHNISLQVKYISCSDRTAAEIWIIQNQLGRRNITDYQRVELALKLKDKLRAKAKENQGVRTDLLQNSAKGLQPIDTRQELAKVAGVSHDTVHKVKTIQEYGIEPLKDKVRSGEISINAASSIAKAPEEEQKTILALTEKEIIAKAQELSAKYKAEAEEAKKELAREKEFKQKALFDKQDRIAALELERSNIAKERDRLLMNKQADDACIIRQDSMVEKLNEQITELKTQIAEPKVIEKEKIVEIEKRIEVIPEDYDVLKVEVTTLKEKLRSIRQKSGEELSQYQVRVDDLTHKLNKKEKQLESFEIEQKQFKGLQKINQGMASFNEAYTLIETKFFDQLTRETIENNIQSTIDFLQGFLNKLRKENGNSK